MGNTVKSLKKEIREQMLERRNRMSHREKTLYDHAVCEVLWGLVEQKEIQSVHTYLPMGSEVDIVPFIAQCLEHQLTVVVPQTLPDRQFNNLVLSSLQGLERGVFGTSYPSGNRVYKGLYDLIIVPGLACDGNRSRLGYGGGYYDTFLAHHPKTRKMGLFYPFQRIRRVPTEDHDVQLDEILILGMPR
ncbi:5-formyltetrahydrofolate cyclo-ligase [Flagellimonas sediminis]|jgi:5-formyltetrahydrofolate cyclo-ligase|uniref:5-formyltetrahydrofolate cyclo-ligase n=1 Tax=Flagellimonas sediminis TaxID=2696468 RepID=A0A6I5KXG1_9FLAO|nr:5-formyltetrahydrofolate cyclo-ligase [Allomuricauda sediminis]NDV45303.1 5-formyltetrahydrofolate cyclo-ligase [Allomuricauda sediminis]